MRRQGLSGKKVEYHSIPYKSITHFAVETADYVLSVTAKGDPTGIILVTIDWKFEELGTFVESFDTALEFPVLEVFR